ncbi:nucleotide sugar dehydrogenase [Ectothiorhodospiraceae bacterium 2226]|nr:nucleotide sugar dehydrogenase [Ectothiorhodospiraceae bacterium 2226]
MKVSIFGLGYVGAVSAGCLARQGHTVIGVDPNETKVELINEGRSPIIEDGLGDLIRDGVRAERLSATPDVRAAVEGSDISLICVGTPSQMNGSLDLKYVRRVCEEIGSVVRDKSDFHVVVARSTMLPGSMRSVVIPTLEEFSGKRAGEGFGVCNNPEFLREGTAVSDFYNPPKTVLGESDGRSGDQLLKLYEGIEAPVIRTDIDTAEMVKYADNTWHALKVCFANEIGNICKGLGVDGHKVMEVFCKDTQLNLSPYYLKPGFAFGGSCLPKDVRALTYKARSMDLDLPVLNAILPSNERQIERGLRMIMDKGHQRIGILGFSFKAGTDDLRESPMVEVIERLIGKGFDLKLYDRNVNLARLVGANRDYILNRIPHIARLMATRVDDVLEHGETLVVGNGDPEFWEVAKRLRRDQVLVDLVRIGAVRSDGGRYDGIGW